MVTLEKRKTRRLQNDAYFTPRSLTQVLCERVTISGLVLEPCTGEGAIAQVLGDDHNRNLITNDLVAEYPATFHYNVAIEDDWQQIQRNIDSEIDWCVTNPPFNQAHLILPLAYKYSKVGVAFLLRLSYFEPTKNRDKWLDIHKDNLCNMIIFSQPRPSFSNDRRSDSITVCWAVWRKDWSWNSLNIPSPFQFSYGWNHRN